VLLGVGAAIEHRVATAGLARRTALQRPVVDRSEGAEGGEHERQPDRDGLPRMTGAPATDRGEGTSAAAGLRCVHGVSSGLALTPTKLGALLARRLGRTSERPLVRTAGLAERSATFV